MPNEATPLETAGDTLDPITDAIKALTAAAQGHRVMGAGTPNEQTIPADFAEIACHVITSVAANVGGVETLLAGRPGSWEADYIRQIVHSTAGEDIDHLMHYRTEPITLSVDVEGFFDDLGLTDLYETQSEELQNRANSAYEAVLTAFITSEESDHLDELTAEIGQLLASKNQADLKRASEQAREADDIVENIIERAKNAGSPLWVALDGAQDSVIAIQELWQADQDTYLKGYLLAARRALAARGVSVEVRVLNQPSEEAWEPLADLLHEIVRGRTGLPMMAEPLDYIEGDVVEVLRDRGLTYLDRLSAK